MQGHALILSRRSSVHSKPGYNIATMSPTYCQQAEQF